MVAVVRRHECTRMHMHVNVIMHTFYLCIYANSPIYVSSPGVYLHALMIMHTKCAHTDTIPTCRSRSVQIVDS